MIKILRLLFLLIDEFEDLHFNFFISLVDMEVCKTNWNNFLQIINHFNYLYKIILLFYEEG